MLLLKEELLVAGAFEENWAIRMPPSRGSGDKCATYSALNLLVIENVHGKAVPWDHASRWSTPNSSRTLHGVRIVLPV